MEHPINPQDAFVLILNRPAIGNMSVTEQRTQSIFNYVTTRRISCGRVIHLTPGLTLTTFDKIIQGECEARTWQFPSVSHISYLKFQFQTDKQDCSTTTYTQAINKVGEWMSKLVEQPSALFVFVSTMMSCSAKRRAKSL